MKKSVKLTIAVVAFGLAAGGGVFAYKQFYAPTSKLQYRTQTVQKGELKQIVSANGTINPVTLVSVGTQVSGTVRKLYVDFNSKVEQGQVLLKLDDALLLAQQKQSQANVNSALASFELASAKEARVRSLYEQAYVSTQEMETAVQGKKVAQAQLLLSHAAVEKDRANLAYTVIRSPVSGVVVDRSVDVGQTVAASLQTPTLFKIAQDLSKMQIDANFAEADIGNIRVGQKVKFTVDAFSGKNFKGDVRQVRLTPTIQSNVVTYDVVVDVDNPELILMPGMTAYVNIAVEERNDALLVPNAALRFKPSNAAAKPKMAKHDSSSATVYVMRGGNVMPVSVMLGITDNRNTEVLTGELKLGEEIVLGEAFPGSESKSSKARQRRRMF